MPYILKSERDQLDPLIKLVVQKLDDMENEGSTKGELNYLICRLVQKLYGAGGYRLRSEGIAAVTDAAHELRRRWLNPYEDEAARRNGDLPGFAPIPTPAHNSALFVVGEQHPASDQFDLQLPDLINCEAAKDRNKTR